MGTLARVHLLAQVCTPIRAGFDSSGAPYQIGLGLRKLVVASGCGLAPLQPIRRVGGDGRIDAHLPVPVEEGGHPAHVDFGLHAAHFTGPALRLHVPGDAGGPAKLDASDIWDQIGLWATT